MNIIIKVDRILEYYDCPQIFVGSDQIGSKFMAVLVEDKPKLKYIAVKISLHRLGDFMAGSIDLRSVFCSPEITNDYYFFVCEENKIIVSEYNVTSLSENLLPGENYFYDLKEHIKNDNKNDLELLNSTKPTLYLGFIDKHNSHNIPAKTLGSLLSDYQSTISNCYAKKFSSKFDSELYVEAFQAASFNVKMTCNEQKGLFGSSNMEKIFNIVDTILNSSDKTLLSFVEEHNLRGNAIKSCKNFVKNLVENNFTLKTSWMSSYPENKVTHSIIEVNKLSKLLSYLEKEPELEEEDITLIGFMKKVDSTSNTWTLKSTEEKTYTGNANGDIDFSGIVINTEKYTIKCKVNIEHKTISCTEKINYRLYLITKD